MCAPRDLVLRDLSSCTWLGSGIPHSGPIHTEKTVPWRWTSRTKTRYKRHMTRARYRLRCCQATQTRDKSKVTSSDVAKDRCSDHKWKFLLRRAPAGSDFQNRHTHSRPPNIPYLNFCTNFCVLALLHIKGRFLENKNFNFFCYFRELIVH